MKETEKRNANTTHIDEMSVAEMISALQNENVVAVEAVGRAQSAITAAIQAIEPGFVAGGRLFYVGCGTSGRLGVLDASECPPTFGVSPDKVTGVIAGGEKALIRAAENAEDDEDAGRRALEGFDLTSRDAVIGISAAGDAAFVVGALKYAVECGAVTVAIDNNPDSKIGDVAKYEICIRTGAEPITGSTRMKAGTSQKLVLNMISTALMIRSGYVYENLMINVRANNIKLKKRAANIVDSVTGCGEAVANEYLAKNAMDIKKTIEEIKSL